MKKLNAASNVIRLLLSLIMATMIFIPCINLKTNNISSDSANFLINAVDSAYYNGNITESERDRIVTPIKNAQEEAASMGAFGADEATITALEPKQANYTSPKAYERAKASYESMIRNNEYVFIKQIESGDINNRYSHPISIASIIKAFPDFFTLDRAETQYKRSLVASITGEMPEGSESEIPITPLELAGAVSEDSVQVYLLFKMFFSRYTGLGNIQLMIYTIANIIILIVCLIVIPVKSFISAIKGIAKAIKEKGKWLYAQSSLTGIDIDRGVFIPLGIMLFVPLFLRGSSFTIIYYIAVALALAWFITSAISSYSTSKHEAKSLLTSRILMIASLIVSVVLVVSMFSFDAANEAFNEANIEKYNTDILYNGPGDDDIIAVEAAMFTFPRLNMAFGLLIIIVYWNSALSRLAKHSYYNYAKCIRFIFVAITGVICGLVIGFTKTPIMIIALSALAFALELAYKLQRGRKKSNSKANNSDQESKSEDSAEDPQSAEESIESADNAFNNPVIQGIAGEYNALLEEGLITEQFHKETIDSLTEFDSKKKLKWQDQMYLSSLEEAIQEIRNDPSLAKDIGKEEN